MCCLCLSQSIINVSYVGLGSSSRNAVGLDLSCVIHSSQYYLLSVSQDSSFLSKRKSMSQCCELLETLGGTGLIVNYDPRGFVDLHRKETIYSELSKRCRSVRGKGNHAMSPLVGSPSAPDVQSLQNLKPAQRPKIDTSKTSKAVQTKNLVSALKAREKLLDRAGSSKD